jgi:hypothetical protein
MRIIDAHIHLYDEPGYVEKLLRTMDQQGIEKCCISGLGYLFNFGDDDDVADAMKKYPDRIIGAVYIRPGVDTPEKIERAYEHGFKMVKVTLPKSGYEDPRYFELWQKADQYKMPVLFHTGIVTCKDVPGEGFSSWNMNPMRIEPITREFPDLKIIVAHLGIHWNDDAAELVRMRKNVYVDLTGEPGGWRAKLDRDGLDKYLWWPGAFEKIIFGTDVHSTKVAKILSEDIERLDKYNVDAQTREKIFSGNILKLLNSEDKSPAVASACHNTKNGL